MCPFIIIDRIVIDFYGMLIQFACTYCVCVIIVLAVRAMSVDNACRQEVFTEQNAKLELRIF